MVFADMEWAYPDPARMLEWIGEFSALWVKEEDVRLCALLDGRMEELLCASFGAGVGIARSTGMDWGIVRWSGQAIEIFCL